MNTDIIQQELDKFETFYKENLNQFANCLKTYDVRVLNPDIFLNISIDKQKLKYICNLRKIKDTEYEIVLFNVSEIKKVYDVLVKAGENYFDVSINKSSGCIYISKKDYLDIKGYNYFINQQSKFYKNQVDNFQRPIAKMISNLNVVSFRSKLKTKLSEHLDIYNKRLNDLVKQYEIK